MAASEFDSEKGLEGGFEKNPLSSEARRAQVDEGSARGGDQPGRRRPRPRGPAGRPPGDEHLHRDAAGTGRRRPGHPEPAIRRAYRGARDSGPEFPRPGYRLSPGRTSASATASGASSGTSSGAWGEQATACRLPSPGQGSRAPLRALLSKCLLSKRLLPRRVLQRRAQAPTSSQAQAPRLRHRRRWL